MANRVEAKKTSSSLTSRLLWLTAIVLIVPWLGFKSLSSMKEFLLQGQAQAQLLTAQGLATLLSDRPSLFSETPGAADSAELPLYPDVGPKIIDGYGDDWQGLQQFRQQFSGAGESPQFFLLMSEHNGMVYGLVNVNDDVTVTRHPGIQRLDKSDHLRFYLQNSASEELRVLVTFEGNGPAIVYQMDKKWRYAEPKSPEYRLRAEAVLTDQGYDIEFRFPTAWLGPSRRMGLEVVDVDDAGSRRILASTATFSGLEKGLLNPVIIRSSELESVLQGFSPLQARLWVLDTNNRVKAVVGQLQSDTDAESITGNSGQQLPWWQMLFHGLTGWLVGINSNRFEDFDAATVQRRNDSIYRQALAGEPVVARRQSLDDRAEIVTAAYPITSENGVIGVLLLEKSTRHILQLQRQSLETLAGLTFMGMIIISLLLLVFAYWLTWRVKRLATDASSNVDEFGRFVGGREIHGTSSQDEIGHLAGTLQRILLRLRQHQTFLKNIPRTLRHEINNPLNTISTSLDCIERGEGAGPYLLSARKGLGRIGHVVNSLADAASLEQALQEDVLSPVDLTDLVTLYISHQSIRGAIPIELHVPDQPVMVLACGEHLEEALDKLIDNARDFSRPGGRPVAVELAIINKEAVLTISNEGPQIPQQQIADLFQFMSSSRPDGGKQHYGLGLYIARVIVEHHRGQLSVHNLADGSGVCVTLILPLLA